MGIRGSQERFGGGELWYCGSVGGLGQCPVHVGVL